MRPPHVFGNWKMNTTREGARSLAGSVRDGLPDDPDDPVRVGLFPPSIWLTDVTEVCRDPRVPVGAQAVHEAPEGAHTGHISAEMARDAGCELALVGHSEVRTAGLTDHGAGARLAACRRAGLRPVLCIGETETERDRGQVEEVLSRQLEGGLTGDEGTDLIVAYEPIWAIGTGRTARPEDAQEAHAHVRAWLGERFGPETADACPLLYGGSVKPHNAADLLARPDIDGALVGGASLKAEPFLAIIEAARDTAG